MSKKTKERTETEILDLQNTVFNCRNEIAQILFPKWEEEKVHPEAAVIAMMGVCEEMMLSNGPPEEDIKRTRATALRFAKEMVEGKNSGDLIPDKAKGQESETCQPESDENDRQNN